LRWDTGSSGFSSYDLMAELFERTKTLSKAQVTNTVFRAISIALLRGNIRKDQLERTSESGKATIKAVAATLGIQIRDKGQRKLALTSKTLTFSRMIALFPHMASQLIVSKESLFVNKYASFSDANRFPAQTHKLPIAMLHSGFAGLIPKESEEDMGFIDLLCMCHMDFMVEFSLLITPQEHRSFHALYENQKTYNEAARGSGLIPDEDRIVYLLAFGLLSSDSLDKMLTVAARVSTLNGRQEASVTRNSFTIVEGHVKIVEDDAKWQELLKKAKNIVDASKRSQTQVAAVDSLDGF
ncbi:hypothetical protein CARUB_v10001595mg, partial [Capsella rubella]